MTVTRPVAPTAAAQAAGDLAGNAVLKIVWGTPGRPGRSSDAFLIGKRHEASLSPYPPLNRSLTSTPPPSPQEFYIEGRNLTANGDLWY